MSGESFCFGTDCKTTAERWYQKLYDVASVETQSKMLLFTADEKTELQDDWNNKIVFYSPKITTGVDITRKKYREQFMYITGQSVSSINLLQMATRTRKMTQLSYYSSVQSAESLYDNIDDCLAKVASQFVSNQLGYSCEDIEDFTRSHTYSEVEDFHFNLYSRNCYALDLHATNKLFFFEQELKNCGFTFLDSVGKCCKMDKAMVSEFKEQTQQNRDEKFELLLDSIHDSDANLPASIQPMMERCKLLNLSSAEEVEEYREVIEDQHILEHFFHYNGLKKSFNFCEAKVRDTINKKMIAGVHNNQWFRIKYVHLFAQICGIADDLFAIEKIVMPELSDENIKLIDTLKKLYRKRDGVIQYDLDIIKQLYKFMLDSLTKKLKLIVSVKCNKRDENRNKHIYALDPIVVNKYDRLIEIMNPNQSKSVCINMNFDEDED